MNCIHCNEPGAHPGTRKCTDLEACHGRQEYARGVAAERARHGAAMSLCDVCCKESEPIAVCTACRKTNAEDNYARGVADERARVVADLVKSADRASDDKMGPVKIVLLNAAIRFERGDHEEKP